MKKYKYFVSVFLVTIVIVPSITFASWWNPFTWSWFNKAVKTEIILVATSTTSLIATATTTITTESEKVINTPAIKVVEAPKTTSAIQNCASMVDTQKDACYTDLARATKDHVVCINILDQEKKNNCYLKIASLNKDITICNLIIDGAGTVTKNLCARVIMPNSTTRPNLSTDPRAILYTEFMKNPTLENFKAFCNQAKNIEGSRIEKTLNSSRESLITKKLSFYYDIQDCIDYDEEGNYYLVLDTNLLIPLSNNDSDLEREVKLLYNEKINNLINTSIIKFVIFKGKESIHTPLEWFNYYSSGIDNDSPIDEAIRLNEIYERNLRRLPNVILTRDFSHIENEWD